ncbi:MAG: hypothetical protein WD875_09185, partial [Pirellulales bacterium]
MNASIDANLTVPASASADDDREAFCRFAAWGLRALGADVRRVNGRLEALLPAPPIVDVRRSRADDPRPEWLRSPMPAMLACALDTDAVETENVADTAGAASRLTLTPRSPQAEWLVDRLHALGAAIN